VTKHAARTWVKTYGKPRVRDGILYDVKDSSIVLLVNNPIWMHTTRQSRVAIDAGLIDEITLRRKGNPARGVLIGGICGAAVGVLFSLSVAKAVNYSSAVYVFPAMFAGLGVGIGIIAGSVKVHIPVRGMQVNFDAYRDELKRHAKY
jgi:hypothetical protein